MKKSQIKIQETAFMLLALVVFFALVFVFYSNFQLSKIYELRNQQAKEEAISIIGKISAMPEFSFSCASCIDEAKVLVIKDISSYDELWNNLARVEVREIYPGNKTITIFERDVKEFTSYSSFIPLCSTKSTEGYIWQDCKIAKMIVSVENIKQGEK